MRALEWSRCIQMILLLMLIDNLYAYPGRKKNPVMRPPVLLGSECVVSTAGSGAISTPAGQCPACRLSRAGLSKCCTCLWFPHFDTILEQMEQIWELFEESGRLPDGAPSDFVPPEPPVINLKLPGAFMEADDAWFDDNFIINFRCHITLAQKIFAKFLEILYLRRYIQLTTKSRIHRDPVSVDVTRSYKIRCGRGWTAKAMQYESIRPRYPDEIQNSDSGELKFMTKSAMCVRNYAVPEDQDDDTIDDLHEDSQASLKRPENSVDLATLPHWGKKRSRYTYIISGSNIVVQPGINTCLTLSQSPVDAILPTEADKAVFEAAETLIAMILKKGTEPYAPLTPPEDYYSSEPDDYHMDHGHYSDEASQTSAPLASSMKFMEARSPHQGQYATRILREAGPSNYLDFSLPRAASSTPATAQNPSTAEQSMRTFKACATIDASVAGIGSPQLYLGWTERN